MSELGHSVQKRLRLATLAAVVDAPPRSEDGEPLPDLLAGQRHVRRSSAVLSERRSRSVASAAGRSARARTLPRAAPRRDERRAVLRNQFRGPFRTHPRLGDVEERLLDLGEMRFVHHFILRVGADTVCASSVPMSERPGPLRGRGCASPLQVRNVGVCGGMGLGIGVVGAMRSVVVRRRASPGCAAGCVVGRGRRSRLPRPYKQQTREASPVSSARSPQVARRRDRVRHPAEP
jgi:hypothetical protein